MSSSEEEEDPEELQRELRELRDDAGPSAPAAGPWLVRDDTDAAADGASSSRKRKAAESGARKAAEPGGRKAAESGGRNAAESGGRVAAEPGGRQLQRELHNMMFGFGDSANPAKETMQLMEDFVVDYLQLVLSQGQQATSDRARHARGSTSTQLRDRDLLFALRKDPERYQRVEQILEIYEDQKEARNDMKKAPKEYEKDET